MKNLLIFVVLICSLSCQSLNKWFSREPAAETARTAKHYIFTVHGLAGNETTFGSLLPTLKTHLEYADPKYEVITQTFRYATGAMDADVPQFIESFEQFLVGFFSKNRLGKDDKISIVAHSQGGLVTTLWYAKATSGNDPQQIEFASKVQTIVTEGTPFWGSGMAHIINDKLPFEWMQNLVYKFMAIGKLEVRDMSTASNKIFDFFREKANANMDYLQSPYMLNIAGVNSRSSMQMQRFNMGARLESDQVVNVPSARLGFYFYSDAMVKYVYNTVSETVTLNDFNYSQYFSHDPKLKLIETTHTKVGQSGYGMANVPGKCMDTASCDQPTYAPVFTHLSRCEEKENSCNQDNYKYLRSKLYAGDESFGASTSEALMNQMRTFQLSVNIQLPKDFVPPKDFLKSEGISKYLKVDYQYGYKKSDNKAVEPTDDALVRRESDTQDYRIQLGRYREWGSRVAKHFQETNQLNVQFTGNVKPADVEWKPTNINPFGWNEKPFPLTVSIEIPGLKKRKVTMPLRPTYTTFVELTLEK
ncbi:hypothetical protein CIK05_15040 [Bdellovibrio sp. qaytius]|nr:hypothetical protein CIK05_15040 [Bdellovibrio sp. qaytius]